MDGRDPSGGRGGTDTGNQRGRAGTDVQTHDGGDGHAVGDAAGLAEGEQDTDGGRRALNEGGKGQRNQQGQYRIGKLTHQF